jgi:hypothetical protein
METKKQTAPYGKEARTEVLSLAAERAVKYSKDVRERRVAPGALDLERLERFREPFPASSTDAESVVAMLDDLGSPATVASAGGRYFGFVIGGAVPASLGANWLAGAWDRTLRCG